VSKRVIILVGYVLAVLVAVGVIVGTSTSVLGDGSEPAQPRAVLWSPDEDVPPVGRHGAGYHDGVWTDEDGRVMCRAPSEDSTPTVSCQYHSLPSGGGIWVPNPVNP
jgi:hypothetical protein